MSLMFSSEPNWLHGCSGGSVDPVGMAVIPANCSGQADSCQSQYIAGLGTTTVCCCGEEL